METKELIQNNIELLISLPQTIYEQQKKLSETEDLFNEKTQLLSKIKGEYLLEINSRVDANKKKIFTNDDLRRAAWNELVNSDDELLELRKDIQLLSQEVEKLKLQIEHSYNVQKNIRTMATYLFGQTLN